MNVLLIAPDNTHTLPQGAQEAREVSQALRPVVLNGRVTVADILHALDGGPYDLLWLVAHGNENGIALSDGLFITTSQLTAAVRNSGACCLFLNTCSSRSVGLEIAYELGVDVIATVSTIGDTTAYETGALLARNLAKGLTFREAFDKSKPGQNTAYTFFAASGVDAVSGQQQQADQSISMLVNGVGDRLVKQIMHLQDRVDSLESTLNKRIDTLERKVDNMQPTPVKKIPWTVGFILFVSASVFFFDDFRDALGLRLDVSLVLAIVFQIAAYAFFSYGFGFFR